jgi:hypothetical protein
MLSATSLSIARPTLPAVLPFIESTRRQLLDEGVPARAICYELFGPELVA